MDDTRDLLMDSFTAHGPRVHDTAEVLSNVDARARVYRRNRWALRTTGISLLGAGVVAGGIGVPSLLSHDSGDSGTSSVSAASGDSNAYTYDQEMAAFFDRGYDYNNALSLAKLWNMSDAFLNKVKAKAGLKLLEGQTLPVNPDNPMTPEQQADVQAAQAFFNAGYDYTDAKTLAKMWHTSTYGAKVKAGEDIENGKPVPIQPSGGSDSSASGKTLPTPASIASLKMKELRKVALAHAKGLGPLVKPDGQPVSAGNKAVDAFFAAGYDYTDAVKLGKMWNTSSYRAKIEGGKKIENGETLPIQPGS